MNLCDKIFFPLFTVYIRIMHIVYIYVSLAAQELNCIFLKFTNTHVKTGRLYHYLIEVLASTIIWIIFIYYVHQWRNIIRQWIINHGIYIYAMSEINMTLKYCQYLCKCFCYYWWYNSRNNKYIYYIENGYKKPKY